MRELSHGPDGSVTLVENVSHQILCLRITHLYFSVPVQLPFWLYMYLITSKESVRYAERLW